MPVRVTCCSGALVGAGIFSFLETFANATGPIRPIIRPGLSPAPACTCWRASFNPWRRLNMISDAGVFAYTKGAGFGDYPGFLSAFLAVWIGSCIGNASPLGPDQVHLGRVFFRFSGDGNTVVGFSIIVSV